ncbi:MAG: hypothetical protein Q9163_006072 [Psora crenata]
MPTQENPQLLAYLVESDDIAGLTRHDIRQRQDLYLGRDPRKCQIHINDPSVSGQHLRIYSVCYDEDDTSVEPLVYAQNLSVNVALWSYGDDVRRQWYKIRKGQAILLSEGDALRVSPRGRVFSFKAYASLSAPSTEQDPIEELEQRDLAVGGDLRSHIDFIGRQREDQCPGFLEDHEACNIVYQLLQGLVYLHDKGVAHRDIKPENILISPTLEGERIILADFGSARRLESQTGYYSRRMFTLCGTPNYVAPEVCYAGQAYAPKGYTMAADMYSVGTLTTALFGGQSYFTLATCQAGPSEEEIMKEAIKCDFGWLNYGPEWNVMSWQAKDFVKKLLVLDEKARLRAKQSLEHGWFTTGAGDSVVTRYQNRLHDWQSHAVPVDFDEDINSYIRTKRLEHKVCGAR